MYFGAKMTSNGNKFNYKVVVFVKTYNFCIDHLFHPRPFEFSNIVCSKFGWFVTTSKEGVFPTGS